VKVFRIISEKKTWSVPYSTAQINGKYTVKHRRRNSWLMEDLESAPEEGETESRKLNIDYHSLTIIIVIILHIILLHLDIYVFYLMIRQHMW
jgi:hypothetical protein